MKPTKSCFPGLSSGSAAYRFVRYHGPHVDTTSLLEVAFISPHFPPPHPFLRPCQRTSQRWLLTIWATAEGHCGPQHLATASPFPTEFRIQHTGAMGFHQYIFCPGKFIPGWILYSGGTGQSLERLTGFLAIFGGSMHLYFRGIKLAMYLFQSEPSHVALLTRKLVHVLRLSSLSWAVFLPLN